MKEKEILLHQLSHQVLHGMRERSGQAAGNNETAPIVRLVNEVLELGVELSASDIHIEPVEDGLRIRYRVDGKLLSLSELLPKKIQDVFTSRLKIMAGMDTSERRKPLDGHISYFADGRTIDLRVASMPVKHGETMVVRLLNGERRLRTLEELGFTAENQEIFRRLVHTPAGLLAACGPMNSGKTTTLYAGLQEINREDIHIMTIEDPVEGVIAGVNQIEVNPKAGLGFAEGLRGILRCDTDAVMIGEIRDEASCEIAVRAALTGHRIFTTIHARDSITSLFRLLEMGVTPYLLTATLTGIVAQRLVRKICPHCAESYEAGEEEASFFHEIPRGARLFRGKGCEHCHGTGFAGRLPLHEILVMDESLRTAVRLGADRQGMMEAAKKRKQGFRTLREDGISKVLAGSTTWQEVRRVLYEC